MKTHLIVVDLMSIVHTIANTPGLGKLKNDATGDLTGPAFYFFNTIQQHLSVSMDIYDKTFLVITEDRKLLDGSYLREKILEERLGFSGYKQHVKSRPKDPEVQKAISDSLVLIREFLQDDLACGGTYFQSGLEADDLIAHLVKNSTSNKITIISKDSDLWQLLDSDRVVMRFKDVTNTEEDLKSIHGLLPNQVPMFMAISGGHNGIIKLKGIGPSTAIKVIKDNSKMLELYEKVFNIGDKITLTGKEIIDINLKLTTLPLDTNIYPPKGYKQVHSSDHDISLFLMNRVGIGRDSSTNWGKTFRQFNEQFFNEE